MYARLAAVSTLAFALLAAADKCNTGPVQCCNDVTTAKDPLAKVILGLLGIVLGPDVSVGLGCSPLSIIGVGSSNSWCVPHYTSVRTRDRDATLISCPSQLG